MAKAENDTRPKAARVLECAAIALLAAAVGVRLLVQEEPSYELLSFDVALAGVGVYGPFFRVCMTVFILLAAVLASAAQLLSGRRWRWLGIEPGLALVCIGAAISCAFAGDKRLAINESVHWLALPVMAMLIVQLATTRRRAALLMSVLVASAAVFAIKCWNQHRYEFADTIEMYQKIRTDFWEKQNVSLDDPRVELYERRLKGQEAFGYASHSNVAGGLLVGATFVALALAALLFGMAQLAVERLLALLIVAMAIGIASAVWLTGSVGALAAGAIGVVFLGVALAFRQSIARRPRGWLGGVGVVVAAGALGVVAYGVSQGKLPGASLRFRWGYWTNTARMIADHPWTGVGAGNFADHYLQYKSIDDPEEVSDPHNFFVLAPARWGVIGGVGVLAMIVGGAIGVSRRRDESSLEQPDPAANNEPPDWFRTIGTTVVATGALGIVVFLCRTMLGGTMDPAQQAIETNVPRSVWIAVCSLCWVGFMVRNERGAPTDHLSRICLAAGLFAMLTHAGVEFTLSQMNAGTVFFVMLGLLGTGATKPSARTADKPAAWRGLVPVALSAAILLAFVVWVLIPAQRVGATLATARGLAARPGMFEATRLSYAEAIAADRLDPVTPAECARWLASIGQSAPQEQAVLAREALMHTEEACRRNPNNLSNLRLEADLRRLLLRVDPASADAARLKEAARQIVALYPESPRNLIYVSELLADLAQAENGSAALNAEALELLDRAIALDAQRDAEEIRRFTNTEKQQILNNRSAIQSRIDGS